MSDKQDPQEPQLDVDSEYDGRMTPESEEPGVEQPLDPTEDPYAPEPGHFDLATSTPAEEAPVVVSGDSPPKPPESTTDSDDEGDEEEEGMLRMSFLEHLEELRIRIIRMLMGVAVAFAVTLTFRNQIWIAVKGPITAALRELGYEPVLIFLTPMEPFMVTWVKLPILAAVFVAAPWVVYQIWGFISPGLYRRERRMAAPFILTSAGLFILGGCFAYFVAFRFGLVFLLGIAEPEMGLKPTIQVTEYVDLFINVVLGVALVFELPVLIFFLTLLRVASPGFLLRHARYAILLIVIAAAIITPTPDVMNLTIFAAPMVLLYFVGVFASYLLVLSREGKRFPWSKVLFVVVGLAATFAAGAYMAMSVYGYKWIWTWPFLTK